MPLLHTARSGPPQARSSTGNSQAQDPLRPAPRSHRPSLTRPEAAPDNSSSAHESTDVTARRKAAYDALVGQSRPSDTPPRAPSRAQQDSTAMASDVAVDVGDTVQVPGGMTGIVKYIGPVNGKAGTFAGVELSPEFAQRGKNDGDVDGIRYFDTTTPGAGIFLPSHRASRIASPTLTGSSYPHTPETPSYNNFDLNKHNAHSSNRTPPTPSLPKFSQSVGPGSRPNFSKTVGHGARAPSPQSKLRPRPSLPRPGSPSRTPAASQSTTSRPSGVGGFSASVRNGSAPSRALTASPAPARFASAKPRTPAPQRSPSRSTSQLSNRSPTERATTHSGRFSNGVRGGQSTSTVHSVRSRDSAQGTSSADLAAATEESERLHRNLEERDRQLTEQAASLAEMESSLAELQSLMAQSNELKGSARNGSLGGDEYPPGSDVQQLRALLREKNEKISMLTTEFDGHRADFRSTIDTLEMASSETERVYEKRVQELLQEVQDLQDRGDDVESFARQLKQLEDLVAELEEGLEDARRGEAEARSEVEFLRGEVERGRSELRREREKAVKAARASASGGGANGDGRGTGTSNREVEARDDEIRGLKAIIHSLSSGPDAGMSQGDRKDEAAAAAAAAAAEEDIGRLRLQTETLQREKSELQTLIERKALREEELERELAALRATANRISTMTTTSTNSAAQNSRPQSTAKSFRSAHEHSDSMTSTQTAIRPTSLSRDAGPGPLDKAPALPTQRPKSSTNPLHANTATNTGSSETNTLGGNSPTGEKNGDSSEFHDASETASNAEAVCDFCEQKGHDVLACPNVSASSATLHADSAHKDDVARPAPLRSASSSQTLSAQPARAPVKEEAPPATETKTPDLGGDGPVAGKESGVVDLSKWCAMCEKDGHESVDCPFEDF